MRGHFSLWAESPRQWNTASAYHRQPRRLTCFDHSSTRLDSPANTNINKARAHKKHETRDCRPTSFFFSPSLRANQFSLPNELSDQYDTLNRQRMASAMPAWKFACSTFRSVRLHTRRPCCEKKAQAWWGWFWWLSTWPIDNLATWWKWTTYFGNGSPVHEYSCAKACTWRGRVSSGLRTIRIVTN